MLLPISHENWQVLRLLVRRKGRATPGTELRPGMSRRTKDGTFLDRLVNAGLLVVVDDGRTIRNTKRIPYPAFLKWYALTERGEIAADRGEVEMTLTEFKILQRHG